MIRPRLALVPLLAAAAFAAGARCVDEESFDTAAPAAAAGVEQPQPRQALADMVREALARSQAVGATRLLAEAALADVDEVRAARQVQATLGGGLGPSASLAGTTTETTALQARGSLTVSRLLYDGGRTDRLADWRTQIAESARYGHLSQQEQIAVNTVALALERSRYRLQVQVWGQYARKMGCLVEALDTIVRADRGRASELVQAKKSLQQAEIAMTQAQSQVRQVEIRLRRLVGDGLPGIQGLSTVLLAVPDLAVLQDDVLRSPDVAQLEAQTAAAQKYAAAVEAGGRPQVSWQIGGSAAAGAGGTLPASANRSGALQVGVAINIPLLNPGVAYATDAARKRALATALQRDDAVESRRFRVAEVWEQTQAAFDRARRTAAVLRDSEQVRNFTLQQWQQLGRRSLFDVMAAEGDHYNLRIAYVNAIHDGQQLNAVLLSLGRGVAEWLR
jgi:outer membrane protein TolC